jgi:hypothetical protein
MGAISFIETMDHTALSNITQEEFEENIESIVNSLPEDVPGNRPAAQSLLTAVTQPKPIISRVGTPISTFHGGEESAEPIVGGTSGSPSTSPFATLQAQLSQLGGTGPGQQNGLTPQTLGEDAKRLLQKTGDAVSKPLNALGRIFSEALDNAEDQLRFLPFGGDGGQHPDQGQNPHSQTHSQYGQQYEQQYETPLHQTGGQIQTPYKPRVKRVNSPITPPSGGSGPSQGQGQQGQQRQSWYESPTKAYAYSNRPLAPSSGDTPGMTPSPAPSKLQSLLGFGFGDGQQQPQSSSSVSDSPTPANNRPAPRQRPPHRRAVSANTGSNNPYNPDTDNEYGGGFQPPSDSYASLVQAQESYLQSRRQGQAGADAPDIQYLQAEIDRAHQKQSEASKGTLRQIFPGVDEEVLEWVLEGSEGQLERSIEMLLEITSGG